MSREQECQGCFTCGMCGGHFVKDRTDGWSEDAARKEHEANFGRPPDDDAVMVCDDCYAKAMARIGAG